MHNAKTLAEFHFDTEKSGEILRSFLADGRISNAGAAKALGYSYDTINDNLRGKNKESKMDFVVKVCAITGHTLAEWCERMLDGVNEEVANTVRLAFGIIPGEAAIDNVEVVGVPKPVAVVAQTAPDASNDIDTPVYLSQSNLTDFIVHWQSAQETTMDRYAAIHAGTYEELRISRDLIRQQYESQIQIMQAVHERERQIDATHYNEEIRAIERHFDNEREAYKEIIRRLEAENERIYKRNRNLAAIISNKKVPIAP